MEIKGRAMSSLRPRGRLCWGSPARPHELRSQLRQALGEAARFDRSAFSPVVGVRVATGVVIALVIGKALGNPAAEASMAAGALLAGIPGAINSGRISLRALGAVAMAMALSTFVGSLTGELGWLHTAVLVPWCLLGGLLMGLGSPASAVGTQGIAAMIVFGRFAEAPVAALHLAGYVLAGGASAVVVLGLSRSPVTSAVQRRAIAAGLVSLAAMTGAGATRRKGVASAEALEAADRLLNTALLYDADERARLRGLVDVARRARLEVLAIEGLARRRIRSGTGDGDPLWGAVEDSMSAAAAVFRAMGQRLTGGEDDPTTLAVFGDTVQRARALLLASSDGNGGRPEATGGGGEVRGGLTEEVDSHLAALAGQVRAGAALVDRTATGDRRRYVTAGVTTGRFGARARFVETLDSVRAHVTLRSPVGRHALRLAVVVTGAELLALHTPLRRGYWIALTASVVLRPDFSVTFSRGLARMLGTSMGVLLAGLLAVALHPRGIAEIVAIGLLGTAAVATFQVGYAVYTGFLTGLVVLLVGIVSPATFSTALDRLVDTLIGGALALVVYGFWPTWSEQGAAQAFANLVKRQEAYLHAVLAATTGERTLDPDRLRRLAREARLAKAEADDAFGRAEDDPESRRFRSTTGQGILASLSRISLATHALRTDLEDGRPGRPVPEAKAVADAFDDALGRAAGSLIRSGASGVPPPLRRYHDQLAVAVSDRPDTGPLVAETDELVDAVDTLGGLLRG